MDIFLAVRCSLSVAITHYASRGQSAASYPLFKSEKLIMKLPLLIVLAFHGIGDAIAQGPDFDIKGMMDKNCPKFRCSKGFTPAPKSRQKFESTGCSSMGGGSMMMAAPGENEKPYESCCDQWHACYQICGVSKKTCDNTFESCAKQACGSDEQCTKDVELNNMMMKLGGCKGYDEAQYKACECAAEDQISAKREAAIRYFYKKQAPENVDKAKSLAAKAESSSKYAGLMMKLLLKYPDAIEKKEDPMQAMFDKIQQEQGEKDASADSTESDEGIEEEPDERIEL